ncbi:GIDE domain-containing protein [Streptomyces sp. NPDC058045]|uniref:GIDE domain-containing protein n=1 Tax=Streptomyces sp. NPDC058045 TaxID=3346311 RepID=UPI0036E7107E
MIWIGLGALVVAAVCGYFARAAHRKAAVMESTETLPVKDLRALHAAAVQAAGEGSFRYRCELVGQVQPHVKGALRSELAEQDCVWHRHRITRRYEETYRDSDGNQKRRTSNEVVSEFSSSTAFFVADASGRMVVRPGQHQVTGAEKVLDRFDPHTGGGNRLHLGPVSLDLGGGSGTIGFQREEWLVRPGSSFYVLGEAADPDGKLAMAAPAEGGLFTMSVKSEEELLRGENNKVLGFGIGAGVAALAGVVLLALGVFG